MSSHPVAYEGFAGADDRSTAFVAKADVLSPSRGILFGIALSAPLWTAVYLVFRSMWS